MYVYCIGYILLYVRVLLYCVVYVVGLERDLFSLVRITEELLEWKNRDECCED
jgi:hypothetical protein